MEVKKETKRIVWIDIVRGMAILFVVLCHVSETLFFYSDIDITSAGAAQQVVAFLSFTTGRLGVPLFLFISGYLLLSRGYDDEKSIRFWKHNLFSLLILTEVWIVIYHIFRIVFFKEDFSLNLLLGNMLFLSPVNMPHMWYLPMLLGLYVSLPLVSMALHKIQIKTLIFPVAVVALYSFGIPTLNVFLDEAEKSTMSNQLSLPFGGGVYGTYLIIGYLFWRQKNRKFSRSVLGVAAGAFLIVTVAVQIILLNRGYQYKVWYDFALLAVISVLLFGTLQNLNVGERGACFWKRLSTDSFGIYLVHKPVHYVVLRYFPMDGLSAPVRMILLLAVVFGLSWGIVEIVSKIPKAGKLLFLIKR